MKPWKAHLIVSTTFVFFVFGIAFFPVYVALLCAGTVMLGLLAALYFMFYALLTGQLYKDPY